jgi:hypothetical protein
MFAKQINLTKEICQYAWAKKSLIFNNLINFLAIVALTAQLTSLVSIISHYSDPAVIISSYSVDAGNSIEVADRTSLINDNDWRPYGPAYYRATKLISYFNENILHNTSQLNSKQAHESTLNFYLILVSILSLTGSDIQPGIVMPKLNPEALNVCLIAVKDSYPILGNLIRIDSGLVTKSPTLLIPFNNKVF